MRVYCKLKIALYTSVSHVTTTGMWIRLHVFSFIIAGYLCFYISLCFLFRLALCFSYLPFSAAFGAVFGFPRLCPPGIDLRYRFHSGSLQHSGPRSELEVSRRWYIRPVGQSAKFPVFFSYYIKKLIITEFFVVSGDLSQLIFCVYDFLLLFHIAVTKTFPELYTKLDSNVQFRYLLIYVIIVIKSTVIYSLYCFPYISSKHL